MKIFLVITSFVFSMFFVGCSDDPNSSVTINSTSYPLVVLNCYLLSSTGSSPEKHIMEITFLRDGSQEDEDKTISFGVHGESIESLNVVGEHLATSTDFGGIDYQLDGVLDNRYSYRIDESDMFSIVIEEAFVATKDGYSGKGYIHIKSEITNDYYYSGGGTGQNTEDIYPSQKIYFTCLG